MRVPAGFLVSSLGLCCFLATALAAAEDHQPRPSPEERARLNQEWDRQYADYQSRLAAAEARPGMTVADVGAGEGGLTLLLASRVGPGGHVFATDIDPRALATLRRLRADRALDNVTVIEGQPLDPALPPGRVEAAFLIKVYHQLADKVRFLTALREQLAPGALLFVVDVNVHQGRGEISGSVSDPEDCRADARAAGFEVVRLERFPVVDLELYQLVVRKPSGRPGPG